MTAGRVSAYVRYIACAFHAFRAVQAAFTPTRMRRILSYVLGVDRATMPPRDRKIELLRREGALNRRPQRVRAPWFLGNRFFDARDLVQVKYEMLRHVRVEGADKTQAAALFGVSRPTFYQAEADFARAGLAGLIAKRRGPKSAHKLTPQIMAFIEARLAGESVPGARVLARELRRELGITVHPRSIERALARKKKQQTFPAP